LRAGLVADVVDQPRVRFRSEIRYLSDPKVNSERTEAVEAELAKAREGALASVRKALNLDPSTAVRLKELLWVTAAPEDDDLAVFQKDPDFNTLLPLT
jgi:hypothetical protein